MNLVVFLPRVVSLTKWERNGLLTREKRLFQRLQASGVKLSLVTYGTATDIGYANSLPGIRILCNRFGLPLAAYETWMGWLHGPWLLRADAFKTVQTFGADIVLRVARLWQKPLIARCGYMLSDFALRTDGGASSFYQSSTALEKLVFGAAAAIVVTTPAMAADVKSNVPHAADRVEVIPNFVDTGHFRPAGTLSKTVDVIYVGRVTAHKNIGALLAACDSLAARITIIGDGPQRAELQQRFSGGPGRVQWAGNVPNAELPERLNQARLFVLPSFFEGHPKALIEAMACGLAVVGTNVPGIRELITHGQTGWLCNPEPAAIRQAIEQLLAQPAVCDRLGENARRFVEANFALDKVAAMELALLRRVTTAGRASHE